MSRLAYQHTHPSREVETSLGNLFADALAEMTESDLVFLASGSIRTKEIGPVVTLKDLMTCFPYNDALTSFTVTGGSCVASSPRSCARRTAMVRGNATRSIPS